MARSILFDRHDLALRMGTGIATYARCLAAAARNAGYGIDALASGAVKPNRRAPILSEVELFEGRPQPSALLGNPAILHGICRMPFGVRPDPLMRTGIVLDRQPSAIRFDRIWIARHLFVGAQAHYRVYGRRARVTLPALPALFHATQPLPLVVKGCPNIVTIHDLVPLRMPYFTLDNKRAVFNLLRELCHDADHIVTVSECSRQDIVRFFGVPESRISNIWQASSLPPALLAQPEEDAARDVAHLFGLDPGGYFLYFGALEPKKNVARLIDAYAASGSTRPLVIAGGEGWQNESEHKRINDPRFVSYRITGDTIMRHSRVRRIEYLPLEQLIPLIRSARALLFPSLYEGFGLPVLEAMTLGTPVMTSTVSSLPEIAGDAALCVDPYDVAAMAEAIRALDADSDLCAELARRGRERAAFFSMERYTERLAALYDRVL